MILIEIWHKGIKVIINTQLVFVIFSHVGNQKSIALLYKIYVYWIIVCLSINLYFYEAHSNFCNFEISHKFLRFSISSYRLHLEKNEVIWSWLHLWLQTFNHLLEHTACVFKLRLFLFRVRTKLFKIFENASWFLFLSFTILIILCYPKNSISLKFFQFWGELLDVVQHLCRVFVL